MQRRDVLKSAAALALAAVARNLPARSRDAWPPYRDMLAIDGSSGTGLEYLEPGDPAITGELDALRRARLTAIMVTVAPQGAFWLDDAAFERAKAHLQLWHKLAATYPSHLMMIATGEEVNRVPDMLMRAAELHEEAVRLRLDRLFTAMTPMITAGLGIVIGGLILSIMSAILSVNDLALR